MRKYISLLVIISIVCSMLSFSVVASETVAASVSTDEDAERLFSLGLLPHTSSEKYNPNAAITRGELAWIIGNIYNYKHPLSEKKSSWNFFGDSELEATELKDIPTEAVARFEDVPISHWAYDIIESVVGTGLMNGVSATRFLPDDNVTAVQLAKTLVVLMGYTGKAQALGGYPDGYVKVATELKLLRGINTTGVVTNDVLVSMLNNCLEVRLMEYDGMQSTDNGLYEMYVSSEETFLTGILGLNKLEGVMTDNSASSLYGESIVSEGQFVIGGTTLKAESTMIGDLIGFIGRDIECYYVCDPDDRKNNYIVYAELTGNDRTTTIAGSDFMYYSDNSLYYSDNNALKKCELSWPYGVIYNGKTLSSWEDSVFDIDNGTLTVISGATTMDYVIIENYETWFTGAVDYEKQRVYSVFGNDMINFEDYDYIKIFKADGTRGAIEDIPVDSVLNLSKTDDTIVIYICDKKEVIKIETLSKVDEETILGSGDREYVICDTYLNYDKRLEYQIGDEVTLYMNKFGEVAWMVQGAVVEYRAGYIYDCMFESGLENKLGFLIYDINEQMGLTLLAGDEKIRVSDEKGDEKNISISSFWSQYGSYRGIVRYSVDADNIITYVELPITDLTYEKDKKLKLIGNLESVEYNGNNFGGKALSNSATKVICVDPDNTDTEDGYSVSSVSSIFSYSEGKDWNVVCYGESKESLLSNYIVYETPSRAGSINITPTSHAKMAVVKKLYSTYDDDEGVVDAMDVLAFTNNISGTVTDSVLKIREGVVATTILKNKEVTVEPGDIIIYGTDKDGFVIEIRLLWDENAVNPDSPYGSKGMLTDCKGFYGVGEDEPAYDSSNYFTGDTTQLPNPMSIVTTTDPGGEVAKNSSSFAGGPFLVHYGFAARYKDNIFVMTSQDITAEEYDPTGFDGKHKVRVWNAPTNVIAVELSGKNKVSAAYGGNVALNPIKPNDVYKSDCSRMITVSAYGLISRLIVINGRFE